MIQITEALLESNFSVRFFTCGIVSSQSIKFRILESFFTGSAFEKIQRRARRIPTKNLKTFGVILEILIFVSTEKFRPTLIKIRNIWFSLRVIPYILYHRPILVISQGHSNSMPIYFANKMKIKTLLNVSIAHHDWMVDEFERESRANPIWSKYLQHNRINEYERKHLDREIENASYLLASSNFTVSTFLEQGIAMKKFFVAPLGFDFNKFKKNGNHVERNGIIFVGQLTQRKGISYLLDAYDVISKSIPLNLYFVGRDTSGMGEQLKEIPGIFLFSHKNQDELNSMMQKAKYFILPSLAEGFALSALEAMACGLIVIVSDRTFAEDIVKNGENGYVVDPRNINGIIEIINNIESDPILANKLSMAAIATSRNFTWEKYRVKVRSIINEILI